MTEKDLIMPYVVREIIKKMMWPLVRKRNKNAQNAIKYCWLHREIEYGGYEEDKELTKKEMFEKWEKHFNKKGRYDDKERKRTLKRNTRSY